MELMRFPDINVNARLSIYTCTHDIVIIYIVFSIITGAQWTKVNIAAFQTAKLLKGLCMHGSCTCKYIYYDYLYILKQLNQMT